MAVSPPCRLTSIGLVTAVQCCRHKGQPGPCLRETCWCCLVLPFKIILCGLCAVLMAVLTPQAKKEESWAEKEISGSRCWREKNSIGSRLRKPESVPPNTHERVELPRIVRLKQLKFIPSSREVETQ